MLTRKMLTLSTAHLKPSTREFLTNYVDDDCDSMDGVIVYPKSDYGWFVFAYPDHLSEAADEADNIPADLRRCVDYALANDCLILDIDCDGCVEAQLTRYWDEPEEIPGCDIYTKMVELAEKYGLAVAVQKSKVSNNQTFFSITALNTGEEETPWLLYNSQSKVLTVVGNTDNLNVWLSDTRPDFTPEKCVQFVADLNALFGLSGDHRIRIKDLIAPEDWNAIADIQDAYADDLQG